MRASVPTYKPVNCKLSLQHSPETSKSLPNSQKGNKKFLLLETTTPEIVGIGTSGVVSAKRRSTYEGLGDNSVCEEMMPTYYEGQTV